MSVTPSTTLQLLLSSIVGQLANNCPPLNNISVYTSINADELCGAEEVADSYVAIKPLTFDVDQRTLTGGSNIDLYIHGFIEVWLWTRLDLDAGRRHDEWLESPLGCLNIVQEMIACLNMFVVNGQPVPMRLIQIGQFSHRLCDPNWGSVCTKWQVEWHQLVPGTSVPYPV